MNKLKYIIIILVSTLVTCGMAYAAFPTSLDSLSAVTTGDTITATAWNAKVTAINSLETKVGIDSSAVTSSIDYLIKSANSSLGSISRITKTDGVFIVADGTNFVGESGATARTSIGLGTANHPTFAGVTTSADIAMTDNSITGIDTLTFTDTAGTIAGIANGNLIDKTVITEMSGQLTLTSEVFYHSHSAPLSIMQNTTAEDAADGRESRIQFRGKTSSGTAHTLARIFIAHEGTGNDQKGYMFFGTNDGSDNWYPTERMRIDSNGIVLINQNTNNISFEIDSEATSATGIDADFQNTSGDLMQLSVNGSERFTVDYTGRGVFGGDSVTIATAQTPVSTSTCVAGEIAWDTGYIYVCTATNEWERAALTGGY